MTVPANIRRTKLAYTYYRDYASIRNYAKYRMQHLAHKVTEPNAIDELITTLDGVVSDKFTHRNGKFCFANSLDATIARLYMS